MIRHLYIKNFILINELHLDFNDGFSAFIGETGAGKSIFIDAISLLCADRASSSYVSKGFEKAIIEGTFDISNNHNGIKVLQELGFDTNDMVIFTREIFANGKSIARINHRIVTLSLLKECINAEIDIHGQRDNQYLLNNASHIHLLDQYLNLETVKKEVSQNFNIYRTALLKKENIIANQLSESDIEFFQYQYDEIKAAKLVIGEDKELELKEKQFKSLKGSFDKLNQIIKLFDDIDGLFYNLQKAIQTLNTDFGLENEKKYIQDLYYSLSDSMEPFRKISNTMDMSEEEINEMEERLFTLQKMKRKYGGSIEEILNKKIELETKINATKNYQQILLELDQEIDLAYQKYILSAQKLSQLRHKGFMKLDKEIESNLADLELHNAKFHTHITKGNDSKYGFDKVEFLISMNRGEDLKPLNKTASGGELSRLMLGLKVIFTSLQGIETIIFDEIDTGVSGPVATAIGKKMKILSKKSQVFSVTHLAPVAACAEHHYLVSKYITHEHKTETTVDLLNENEVIQQLALISSGEITELSEKAARELFTRNQN